MLTLVISFRIVEVNADENYERLSHSNMMK